MRVVHLIPSLSTGGAEAVCADIAANIDPQRFESLVVTLYSREQVQRRIAGWGEDVARAVAMDRAMEDRLQAAGIEVRCLHKESDVPAILRFKKLVRSFRPHVVHGHLTTVQFNLAMAASHKPPARLHTVHTLAEHEAPDAKNRWVRRAFFATGGKPIAISEAVARSLRSMYGVNPDVVLNRISLDRFAPRDEAERLAWRRAHGFDPDDLIGVMVGRLRDVKNPLGLVRAFRPVAMEQPRAKLVLVGDGDLRADIEALVAELGLDGQVRLLGSRSDVPEILAASDYFVLNSRYEGLCVAIMEALAAGLPVVATGVGGIPEVVDTGSTGLLVPEGEPEKMVGALSTMVRDEAFRRACARRARRDALERFDVRLMAEECEALYERYGPTFR